MTRAFTLLETLLATALLSALAVACAGFLRAAPAAVAEAEVSADELGDLADRALRTPAALGLAAVPRDGLPPWRAIPWPDDPAREPVAVEVHAVSSHAWVCFSCGDLHVSRWIRLREGEP